jgi:hypothetical protein
MEFVLPTKSSFLRVTSNDAAIAEQILKRSNQKQRAQSNLVVLPAQRFTCLEFFIPTM